MPHIQPAENARNNFDVTRYGPKSYFTFDPQFERNVTRLREHGPRVLGEFLKHTAALQLSDWQMRTSLDAWVDHLDRIGGKDVLTALGADEFHARPLMLVPAGDA
jgi:hypothetical protein